MATRVGEVAINITLFASADVHVHVAHAQTFVSIGLSKYDSQCPYIGQILANTWAAGSVFLVFSCLRVLYIAHMPTRRLRQLDKPLTMCMLIVSILLLIIKYG